MSFPSVVVGNLFFAVVVSRGRHPVVSLYGIRRLVRERQRRTTDSRLRLSGMTTEGGVVVIPEAFSRGSVVAVVVELNGELLNR